VTNASREVFVGEAVGREAPWREKAEVEGSYAAGAEDVNNVA
jgi:hypothetical protein